MAKVAAKSTAKVEVIGKLKASKFEGKPQYRPVLFVLPDGSQQWESFDDGAEELAWLKKGQSYEVIVKDDGKLTLIQPANADQVIARYAAPDAVPPTAPAAPIIGGHVMTDGLKRQVVGYVGEMAPLYAYCYQQAQAQLAPHSAPEAAVQGAASSLFISAQRRFNLA